MQLSKRLNISLFFIACVTSVAAFASGEIPADSGSLKHWVSGKLDVPLFFGIPRHSYLPSRELDQSKHIVDYIHPESRNPNDPTGLRLYIANHSRHRAVQELAESGIIQTGDIILTSRPEWAGVGPYANLQLGLSHAGMLIAEKDTIRNVDNPLTKWVNGNLDAMLYTHAHLFHIVRPRQLTEEQQSNIRGWLLRLSDRRKDIFPRYISFNDNYLNPMFDPSKPPLFIKTIGEIALGEHVLENIPMFCSEFAWTILSLRNCDPNTTAPEFTSGENLPACVSPVFTPMPVFGTFLNGSPNEVATIGLAEGPAAIFESEGLPLDEKHARISNLFTRTSSDKLSKSHANANQLLTPYSAAMIRYFSASYAKAPEASVIRDKFNAAFKPNYSPSAFLINTFLPRDNPHRVFDYVGTIMFTR
jgi:hypothetical protein